MRKILFRGIRVDGGGWVEGNLFQINDKIALGDGPFSSSFIAPIFDDLNINTLLNNSKISVKTIMYQVIDKTVSQATGLNDKNGKMIFEGL